MPVDVLVVDDEAPITRVLSRSLLAHGYSVRVATTGEDALVSLAEARPDVMLLDINLPDLTGWEVLRRMPPDVRARVPVIVFSAAQLARHRVEEFEPAAVLLKPFPMDALLRLLGELASTGVKEA
ncbi:MAG: response regulator [Dehalococcoidia bacterium]